MELRYSFSTPTFQAKPEISRERSAYATAPVGAVKTTLVQKVCKQDVRKNQDRSIRIAQIHPTHFFVLGTENAESARGALDAKLPTA